MDPVDRFNREKKDNVEALSRDEELTRLGLEFVEKTAARKYVYNFTWMGRPIIQFPQDMVAMQELVWRVRPDLIVETGVAHGGSLVYYASLLEMMGIANGRILGIDIDIREHNRRAIEDHPMSPRIVMLEGSSVADDTVEKVRAFAADFERVMVVLDSNHTHAHVLEELRKYSPLVTEGSYLIVMDTVVEKMPAELHGDRPWGPGNSPGSAVEEFLGENRDFEVDRAVSGKLLVTSSPGGYLRRVTRLA